ncbi:MAG: hypothetical protein JXX14_21940, partial [Deltaproteobacteria bacterium]|nr:hypothetical protein [Deltaproteobacteria bacterium]
METKQFGGMIYGAGHSGESCVITVTSGGLDLTLDGNAAGRISWAAVKITATGTNDKYLRFDTTAVGDDLNVWTGDKTIIDAIRSTGAPMQVLSQLDSVGAYRTRRAFGRNAFLAAFLGVIGLGIL